MKMRLFAADCEFMECVPAKQLEGFEPITEEEKKKLNWLCRYRLTEDHVVVRFNESKLFLLRDDMAVCIYDYPRSFK